MSSFFFFCPHRIVSFGAPTANEYRLVLEAQEPVSFQTTMVHTMLDEQHNAIPHRHMGEGGRNFQLGGVNNGLDCFVLDV